MPRVAPLQAVVLMPVRDDWISAAELIRRIDEAIFDSAYRIKIILIDDGSIQDCNYAALPRPLSAISTIQVLRLRCNVGHQRAIAIGLVHVEKTIPCDAVLVMDADGQDTPEGVLKLLDAYSASSGSKAVFAERSRRSESLAFQLFYLLYKALRRALTGVGVRVGNFSILPQRYLHTLSAMSDLWNHYAAAVYRSQLPFTTIPIPRGDRIAGTTRMNFVGLVAHGLSAIAVFGDIVGARLLVASLAGSILAGLGVFVVVAIRLLTNWSIPGWATYATGILVIILFQFIAMATSFSFFILSNRTNLGFLPFRDSSPFVAETVDIYSHE